MPGTLLDTTAVHADAGTPWCRGPLAALDTETTGLDPVRDRCVEVALVLVAPDGSEIDGGYETLVDCGAPVPVPATRVHGLTGARLAVEGAAPRACFTALVRHLEEIAAVGIPLVIFNARFDWPLLRAETARLGLDLPGVALLDPLVLDRHLSPSRPGRRRLGDVAAHHGIARGRAHRARDDALAAARVTRALLAAHPEALAARSLEQLQTLQAGWFAHWRDARNRRWGREGREQRISGTWPG